jgi:hypothetical protein
LQSRVAAAPESLVITYEKQEVRYVSAGVIRLLSAPEDASPVHEPPPANEPQPAKRHSMTFAMGLGNGDERMARQLGAGPTYVAFVGDDLIALAGDLPGMAAALDVIRGKRPSLATQDPQGLKIDPHPGDIFVGAGLTAEFTRDNTESKDTLAGRATPTGGKPARADGEQGSFGINLFGSLKGKARLARFEVGEDAQNLYVTASLAMKDAESAEQLKNLASGVRALVSLSQADAKPLLDPLELRTADRNLTLHWSWPTAKLQDLFRQARAVSNDEHDSPTPAPTSSPAR